MSEQMRWRSWLGGCLTLLGLTVVGGGALLYWQLRPRTLTRFDSAQAIPETALATAALETDLEAWQALAAFAPPEARTWLQSQLQGNRFSDLAAAGLDYERDIQPAIGNALVASVPLEGGREQSLFVLGIEDRVQAIKLAATLKEESKGSETDATKSVREIEVYGGTAIFAVDPDRGDRLYLAFRESFLLLSPAQEVVRQAIDAQRGQIASYADRPNARALLQSEMEVPNQVASIYVVDFPRLVAAATDAIAVVGEPAGQGVAKYTGIETLAIGVGASDTGLQMQTLVQFSAPRPQPVALSGAALERFPEDTIGLIYGRALDRSWQEFESQATTDPELKPRLDLVVEALKAWQLDLQEDFIGWLDGEFAFGAIATDANPLGLGVALWLETSQPETGRQTLEKLDRLARFLPGVAIDTAAIEGVEVTQWRARRGDLQGAGLAHGWLASDRLLVTAGLPFDEVAAAPRSLEASEIHSTLVAGLPGERASYVYLNAQRLQTAIDRFPQQLPPIPDESAILAAESLRGFSASVQQRDPMTLQIDMTVALQRYEEQAE